MMLYLKSIRWIFLTSFLFIGANITAENINPKKVLREPPKDTVDLSIRFHHIESIISMSGLAAHWAMDEGSGYKMMDQSGNGHTAYLLGEEWNTSDSGLTASFRRNGRRGGSVYMTGRQALKVNPSTAPYLSKSFTISTWLKSDFSHRNRKEKVIVEQARSGQEVQLSFSDDNAIKFSITGNDRTVFISQDHIIPSGNWFHLTLTYEEKSKQAFLYLNGQQREWEKRKQKKTITAAKSFTIGNSTNGELGFRGWLDEFSLYDRPLAARKITNLYTIGLPKVYVQTRETIDPEKKVWTTFKGNQPIPHPKDEHTELLLRFDGSAVSRVGIKPTTRDALSLNYVPAEFGGALDLNGGKTLTYFSPLSSSEGTLEMWVLPQKLLKNVSSTEQRLLSLRGSKAALNMKFANNNIHVSLRSNMQQSVMLSSDEINFSAGTPTHLGISWGEEELILYVNGVESQRKSYTGEIRFDQKIKIGGTENNTSQVLIDDLRLSSKKRGWKEVCPRGHVNTESTPLDLKEGFTSPGLALMHWKSLSEKQSWTAAVKHWEDDGSSVMGNGVLRRSIKQTAGSGFNALYHKDAYGFNSSIEAGISLDTTRSGWAGVFVQASHSKSPKEFDGYSFAIQPVKNKLRLAVHKRGEIVHQKTLHYDFNINKKQTYTLTLTSLDGIMRGYIDGHNFISMRHSGDYEKGFAGIFTNNTTAYFDDVHFTALTPSTSASRTIERRIFYGSLIPGAEVTFTNSSLTPFRWKKRHGMLPWNLNFKKPEPAGNIFGPTQNVTRPNPTRYWRSEDAANSDLIAVNGTVYYFMRGNPDLNGPHGPAAIGVLTASEKEFDGLHFKDSTIDENAMNNGIILRGHEEKNPLCTENPNALDHYQLNDEGTVYMDGKIWLFAKEFRHNYGDCPSFGRIVYGAYDVSQKQWVQTSPFEVDWSSVDPLSSKPQRKGLYATPEATVLREPETDQYVIYFYHEKETAEGIETSGVVGLYYNGETMKLHPDYPRKDTFVKHNHGNIYGERILFDNGIYYMHVNAGSTKEKLQGDWPDRFQLYSSLHPYKGPWTGSSFNQDRKKIYFSRGGEFDPDNAAIWQGTMFKHKGQYYMYFENFHAIDDVNVPYKNYDRVHSGSRVGFSTAN